MLTSLVVSIKALEPGIIQGGTSRAVHGFWYGHWRDVNPALGNALHQTPEIPPFTLSPVMGLPRPKRGEVHVREGQLAWFRVVTLSKDVSHSLTNTWGPGLPSTIQLAGLPWSITRWTISPEEHPWAGHIPYKVLSEKHLFSTHPPKNWKIEFFTPTTFHGAVGHLPFPLPDSLVSSWLRRWQAFAPISLPENLPQLVREGVVVSSYQLKTVPVRHGERLTVGCVGSYKLHALNLPPAIRAAVDTLVQYAFYVGSGHRTTQGMGMTRRVR